MTEATQDEAPLASGAATRNSAKGGVLLKGTDHKRRVSVKLMMKKQNRKDADPESGGDGVEMVEENNKSRDRQPTASAAAAAEDSNNNDHNDEFFDENGIGHSGRWTTRLCDCWQVIWCKPVCVMSYMCNVILLGQLMTRLGLDWCGIPNPVKAAGTFSVIVLIWMGFWASFLMAFGVIFIPCMTFYLLAIYTRTRYEARRYFQIPAEYCGDCCHGAMEDCCFMTCCSCCATIQIHRQTHDERRYKYRFEEPTGLPTDAPPLYEDRSYEVY